jgi:diguanylate cyclase (GGDEF)-like protein
MPRRAVADCAPSRSGSVRMLPGRFVIEAAIIALSFALAASLSPAQRLSFSSVTNGLENLNVNCITQDGTGYLWVGTENGLYRYDGRQFKKFGPVEGIRGRTIQSLFSSKDGTLFVGTTAGLYFLGHDGHIGEIKPPAPVEEFSVRIGTVFSENAHGEVAMADRSGAYTLNKAGEAQWIAKPLALESGNIWSVLYGPDGTLWYGCGFDLCRYSGGKTAHVGSEFGLPKENWLHLLFDREGRLWMRSWVRVVEILPAEKRIEIHDLPGEGNAAPYNWLSEDASGRVIAAQGASFGIWENNAWHMITEKNGLSRYDISVLFADREGSIWIGMVGHGLMRWVGQDRWEGYTAADGLSDDIVWGAVRDRTGRLWIGTESGLDWIAPGSDDVHAWKSGGIATVRAASMAVDDGGNIWMGSAAGSLVRIIPQTMAGREWKSHEVYRLMMGPDERLWIATGSGLFAKNTTNDLEPQLESVPGVTLPQRFSDLCVDGNKKLWAASDAGLFRLDANGWRKIDLGLAGINPFELAASPDGSLWASGAFPGIVRLRITGDKVVETQHFSRPHLLSEQVVAIYVDRRGWLWVGQDAGLTVFDGHSWRSFTQSDGLIWNDTDSYAISEDGDGSMWIGTSGGISHLMRPNTFPNPAPRTPIVADMNFGGQEVANGSGVKWSANPLTISITALSFSDVEHLHFRYRLLGLEQEWVDTNEETIRYARLEPRDYRFQATTVDDSGTEVSPVAEVDFSITPRWWQNQFLRWTLVVLCAFGAVQLWRLRIRVLEAQKQHLEVAVQHRTEDLEREKTELLRAREQMRQYAEHDDLTGLWNHRIIVERLHKEVEKSQRERTPLSVILVDLDHFKEINDSFGHLAGDQVLKEMGAIFLRSIRFHDWVGRYGGEEFLLILPGSSFANARLRAEQLRMEVASARLACNDRLIQITASFGVASGLPTDAARLIKIADTALYEAKAKGRNCVVAEEV